MSESGLSPIENRILSFEAPSHFAQDQVRICLQQLRGAAMSTEDGQAQRQELLNDAMWDREYYEERHGVNLDISDEVPDIQACGIGGCTLRIYQAAGGDETISGNCKANDYCLKQKFEAVKATPTVIEGQMLYKELYNTCQSGIGSSYCPNLNCELAAGVSEDMVPGTDGVCAKAQ